MPGVAIPPPDSVPFAPLDGRWSLAFVSPRSFIDDLDYRTRGMLFRLFGAERFLTPPAPPPHRLRLLALPEVLRHESAPANLI